MALTVPELLAEAEKTFRERNAQYGGTYKNFGALMPVLLAGKTFSSNNQDEWNRLGLIIQIVGKLLRYMANPNQGHIDSIHDLGVYSFMLEEIDRGIAGGLSSSQTDELFCQHIYEKKTRALDGKLVLQCRVCNFIKEGGE